MCPSSRVSTFLKAKNFNDKAHEFQSSWIVELHAMQCLSILVPNFWKKSLKNIKKILSISIRMWNQKSSSNTLVLKLSKQVRYCTKTMLKKGIFKKDHKKYCFLSNGMFDKENTDTENLWYLWNTDPVEILTKLFFITYFPKMFHASDYCFAQFIIFLATCFVKNSL